MRLAALLPITPCRGVPRCVEFWRLFRPCHHWQRHQPAGGRIGHLRRFDRPVGDKRFHYPLLAEVLGNRGAEGSAGTPYVDIRLGSSGALSLEVTDYHSVGYAAAGTDPNAGRVDDGNWHRISAVRSSITLQIWVDGVLRATGVASDSNVANIQSLYAFTAGANQDTSIYNLPFNGIMDDLEIYNRALGNYTFSGFLPPIQKPLPWRGVNGNWAWRRVGRPSFR